MIFKLHPNENVIRAEAEIRSLMPDALIFRDGNTAHMVANCDLLVTQHSTVALLGAALGKPFTGQLLNLSEGGLSFQILVSTQPGAAMLLGRGLQMTFASVEKTVPDTHPIRGTITGVTDLMLNEYAVHVRFETPVSINSSTP